MSYAKRLNLKLVPVPQSSAQLANGSRIHIRYVVRQVLLNIGDYSVIQDYKVMEIKGLGVVLGKPWFNQVDPNIDGRTNTAHIRTPQGDFSIAPNGSTSVLDFVELNLVTMSQLAGLT